MPKSKAAVILNVYDMAPMNSYTANLGFGIYHSGVEIYGVEFAYGGHPYPLSGIFDITPRDVEELGEQFKFKESIRVGFTTFTLEDIRFLVNRMGEEYRGDQYHLLNKNCNHFSKHFTQILTGCSRSVPKWVNRLACASSMIPFIEKAIPTEWLTPKRLEDVIQNKDDCEAREHTASCSRGKDAAPCGCPHKKVAPPCGCSQKQDAAPCPHKKDASPCGCPDNAPSCSHKNVYSQRKDEGEQTSGCCFANFQDKSIGTARDHRCDVCGKKSGTEVYRIKHDKVEDEYTGPSKTGRSKSQ